MPHIGALKELKWISVSGTQITPKGLADLREKLPGARIVSDSDQGSLGKPLDAASYLADWSLLKLPEGNPSITDLALESVFQE